MVDDVNNPDVFRLRWRENFELEQRRRSQVWHDRLRTASAIITPLIGIGAIVVTIVLNKGHP